MWQDDWLLVNVSESDTAHGRAVMPTVHEADAVCIEHGDAKAGASRHHVCALFMAVAQPVNGGVPHSNGDHYSSSCECKTLLKFCSKGHPIFLQLCQMSKGIPIDVLAKNVLPRVSDPVSRHIAQRALSKAVRSRVTQQELDATAVAALEQHLKKAWLKLFTHLKNTPSCSIRLLSSKNKTLMSLHAHEDDRRVFIGISDTRSSAAQGHDVGRFLRSHEVVPITNGVMDIAESRRRAYVVRYDADYRRVDARCIPYDDMAEFMRDYYDPSMKFDANCRDAAASTAATLDRLLAHISRMTLELLTVTAVGGGRKK